MLALALAVLSGAAGAQSKATLDVSETLFSVVAAMNMCGYDAELQASSPLRREVRAELVEASTSPDAASALNEMCRFYRDHRQENSARDLAQYVSLALNLGPPPEFAPRAKEADLPPDAAFVLGFVPVLKQYAAAAGLHQVWLKHSSEYQALVEQFHAPVARMIASTDTYLRMPLSGYGGRGLTIELEPMSAPGQVNSRNYNQDSYYIVVAPAGGDIHMDSIRHAYLHFVLDPLIARRATALLRLKPLLVAVQKAPMAEDYKLDSGLLVIECLIRAVEARVPLNPKLPEKERLQMVQRDEAEGFVLTGYFYDQLREFEKANQGLQNAFPDMLHNIDLEHEKKLAGQIQFAAQAAPEVVQASKPAAPSKLAEAERELAAGNAAAAEKLGQEALTAKEDAAHAYFVLARAATLQGNMEGAQQNFQKALEAAKDPRLAAWCHIYLGRIYDLQQEREAAVAQYQAALKTGDTSAASRNAAEHGLKEPYQPPAGKQQQPE